MKSIAILALSGSLRAQSSNSRLVRAAARAGLAGPDYIVSVYESVGALPHFNPDLDGDSPPAIVRELRRQVGAAGGLLLSCPEYAHGVPGSFKNALDWLVASVEFPGKPVALIGGGEHAQAQLLEILRTMSARIVAVEEVRAPVLRAAFDDQGGLRDAQVARQLAGALLSLGEAAAR